MTQSTLSLLLCKKRASCISICDSPECDLIKSHWYMCWVLLVKPKAIDCPFRMVCLDLHTDAKPLDELQAWHRGYKMLSGNAVSFSCISCLWYLVLPLLPGRHIYHNLSSDNPGELDHLQEEMTRCTLGRGTAQWLPTARGHSPGLHGP